MIRFKELFSSTSPCLIASACVLTAVRPYFEDTLSSSSTSTSPTCSLLGLRITTEHANLNGMENVLNEIERLTRYPKVSQSLKISPKSEIYTLNEIFRVWLPDASTRLRICFTLASPRAPLWFQLQRANRSPLKSQGPPGKSHLLDEDSFRVVLVQNNPLQPQQRCWTLPTTIKTDTWKIIIVHSSSQILL